MDARLLEFDLPDISTKFRWGSAGFEEALQWPSLPSGTLTAGDPIPDHDLRQAWLALFCTVTVPIPNLVDKLLLSREKEEDFSDRDTDPLLKDTHFALDLYGKPEDEWSRYEKRRMRKLSERISRMSKNLW